MDILSFFSGIRPNKALLLLGSALGSAVCIVLHNAGVLPLDGGSANDLMRAKVI